MLRCKNLDELHKLGLTLDRNDPTKLIPLGRDKGPQLNSVCPTIGHPLEELITAGKAQWARISSEEKYLTASYYDFGGTLLDIKKLCGDDKKAWAAAYKQIGIDRRRVSEMLLYRREFKCREEAERCSLPEANKRIRRASKQDGGQYDPNQDCFATPSWLYQTLDAEFGFGLDAAATRESAKCEVFFTPEEDALKQDWRGASGGKPVFLNPPFNRAMLPAFIEKAYRESQGGLDVVCILPFLKSYPCFQDYVWPFAEMRHVRGLVVFDGFGPKEGKHAGNIAGPQSFDTVVAIFRQNQSGFSGPYVDRPEEESSGDTWNGKPNAALRNPVNGPSGRAIAGSGCNRKAGDFYATPRYAVEAILEREEFPGTTWEPAQGDGRIVTLMRGRGHDVFGSDIKDGVDFLKTRKTVDNVVTNPPWESKDAFVLQAKRCAKSKIALLLPIQSLGGVVRSESIYPDKTFPFKCLYIFPRRMQFDPSRRNGSTILAAWYVWDRSYQGEPVIRWFGAGHSALRNAREHLIT
jgi:hypothetical protein